MVEAQLRGGYDAQALNAFMKLGVNIPFYNIYIAGIQPIIEGGD